MTLVAGLAAAACAFAQPSIPPLEQTREPNVETPDRPALEPAPSPVEVELPERTVERPTGPVDSCFTTECHTKQMAGRVLHGPTAQQRCEACHIVDDLKKHTYKLIVEKQRLCSYCHTQSERSVVHKPVADGECDKCHDPHGSDHPLQLLGSPSGPLCFPCHKPEEYGGIRHVEGRVEMVGACDVCHESHSSWMPKLLPKEIQELCLTCHEDLRLRMELIGRSHAPVMDGRCLDCHDAHTTEHPGQLRTTAPQLCYLCHDHDAFRAEIESAPWVHGALTSRESCLACHVGHGSVQSNLLAGHEKDLCLSCHHEPLSTNDARVVVDIASLLKEHPRHHGPVRDGKCTPCHDAHASTERGLLIKSYPESFYTPYTSATYALCFECHIETVARSEKGGGVTEFRDKDRNLHFVHVNKPWRGRSCGVCHEVHASSRPFHMREAVAFGPHGWEVEINHMSLPNGGSCAPGCHEQRVYDRGEDQMPETPYAGLKPEWLE
jgi:predicted CXXCH cytochrome family protein